MERCLMLKYFAHIRRGGTVCVRQGGSEDEISVAAKATLKCKSATSSGSSLH